MIFQSYALWPHMTVAENVGYGLRFKRDVGRAERERRVREMLRIVQRFIRDKVIVDDESKRVDVFLSPYSTEIGRRLARPRSMRVEEGGAAVEFRSLLCPEEFTPLRCEQF